MLSADDHRQVLTVFDYDLTYHYAVLDVKPEVIDAARQLADRHPLRAYDAVHLATAWLLKQGSVDSDDPPLTFVCADERLTAIAQAEGLTTENPNNHP